jgi:hypothetical protein
MILRLPSWSPFSRIDAPAARIAKQLTLISSYPNGIALGGKFEAICHLGDLLVFFVHLPLVFILYGLVHRFDRLLRLMKRSIWFSVCLLL